MRATGMPSLERGAEGMPLPSAPGELPGWASAQFWMVMVTPCDTVKFPVVS
jgi:hypothetical protein